ncbi:carbohydrate kinase family protein [Pseudoduganella aquatica]|uniref:Carbohydrate kinase n=1 Tax=Pseudoduganella aquatica TaxID=2660641 RepID=A0A7X4HAI1_9BURK|nr:carbohydrate kinase [Pseudoduganella aquatica]MYN06752.1 carbohydrate kinase [Pseudoduganella aquatica]
MKALLTFGEALIELLQDPSGLDLYHRNAGGAPANVAVGFARLRGQSFFIGMLGADDFGKFLLAQLQHYDVDTRYVRRTAAATTTLAVVALDAGGDRSFSFYRPPSADLLFTADDLDPAAFIPKPYFHFCSNSLTHEPARSATWRALELAEENGCLTSFDVNWRPALWPQDGGDGGAARMIREVMPRAHLLKFSAGEWAWLCGDAPQEALEAHCFAGATELIVITDGGQAVRTVTRKGSAYHRVPPLAVVDTTAAGDAFVAALLRQLACHDIEPDQLRKRLESPTWLAVQIAFAVRCASLACTRYGAFSALPTLAQYHKTE